ncbi:MAG: beta-N-acetylglucosaminidase domain-containing protein [Bacteroidales bacterium]|nr:beta-N-acetylglucosaminidase domain-containing protein [Candidatus Physcousia equi]
MTAQEGTVSFTPEVSIVCDAGIDQPTKDRALQVLSEHKLTGVIKETADASKSVIYLKVDAKVAVEGKFDAHQITLGTTGGQTCLTITGQNTDATFMGLASIEQMMDAKGTTDLPCVAINDYADQLQRGLVEGYYGYPYSVEVKKDLMRFMMRMKMNSYMYGAKPDPYHLSKWKEPYPTSITDEQEKNGWLTQKMVSELCATSAATKVNFIWSIHPGNEFINSATVVDDIMSKFQKMYNLGVRQFGVFVDDVGIPSSDADMATNADRVTAVQKAIENRWNAEGAAPADTVKPLNFVPQIYCRSFAGSLDQYQRFFRALANTPKHVIIYTTGGGVWSVPNATDFNMPKEYLGRDVAWWWNYPCNDNADAQIYPMDMYQNFVDMPAVGNNNRLAADLNAGIGIVSNPTQQGEVAKIALFSVADYAWNNSGFDNSASWEASFGIIMRDEVKAKALRTIAPYLTKNDPTNKFGTNLSEARIRENATTLLDAISVVKGFADSDVESDRLLWREMSPWVLKLEQMLKTTSFYLTAKNGSDRDVRWQNYVSAATLTSELESKEDFVVYTIENRYGEVGSHIALPSDKYLRTYLNNMRTSAVKDIFPAAQTKVVNSPTPTSPPPSATTAQTSTSRSEHVSSSLANTWAWNCPPPFVCRRCWLPTRWCRTMPCWCRKTVSSCKDSPRTAPTPTRLKDLSSMLLSATTARRTPPYASAKPC